MNIKDPDYDSHSDQQFSEIDGLCDRFDQELLGGQSPRIEAFFTEASDAARDGLLAELLAMEIEHRLRRGEEPRLDEYVRRFPEHSDVIAGVLNRNTKETQVARRSSAPDDVPPELPNFHVLRELGRGGMGVVWLAEQTQPVKRRVALKLIKRELTSKEIIARFDVEKQALALMDHQNIARVLDAGTTKDGQPYFVMEFVDGIPITRYCDDNKLSVDERLKLFVPVCKAVQHAHQKGIAHRDLKPSNVLVAVIDGEAVPKIIDFGLAKAVEHHLQLTDATMHTEFGKVVGTVQYMSPEQAELKGVNAEDVDTRTDVYSLGVMLYELLTGSTPLDEETLARNALLKVLEIIREEDPPRPSNRLSSSSHDVNSVIGDLRRLHPARLQQLLRGELDWVVMKALEKEPDRRYQTANDLGQDLSNYLTGETVTARPPSTWYQLQKFARRNRGLVAAMLAIVFALLVGIAGTSYGLIRANDKTKLANEEGRKARTSEQNAILAKAKAESNERRAVTAEELASDEAKRAKDAEAAAKFQLSVARYDAHRAVEARQLLHQIPHEYRDNFEWHYCNRRFQGSDVTCYGHSTDVYKVAFIADVTRLVSAGKSGTIWFWDASTGQQLSSFDGHEGQVLGLAVSPDGSQIASAGTDKVVKVWDAESHEIIRLIHSRASIRDLAFSPTGDRIAAALNDKTVQVWNTDTGDEATTMTGHSASVTGVAFSPDGNRIASCSEGDKTARVWDSRTGEQIASLSPSMLALWQPAFSPDGTRLVIASYGRYSLWDTESWELIAKEGAHSRHTRCIAFSPDGTRFATAGTSTEIKLWDTQTGKLLETLSGHAATVWSVAFSPDGTRLASASEDGTVKIWNTQGDNGLTFPGHVHHVYSIDFSADGKQLASCSRRVAILRDATTGQVKFKLDGHTGELGDVDFNPDGTRLATASDDKTVRIWDTGTGEELAVLKGHRHWVSGVDYSPDGGTLASSSRDGTVKLWDTRTNKEIATLTAHRGAVYCVEFSPDGSCLASGALDSTVKLWDAKTGKEIRTITGHTGRVRRMAFDPEGKRLVSGGYDSNVQVWDVASGTQVATAYLSCAAVFGISFTADGKRFAVCGTDSMVHVYEALSGREIMTISPGIGVSSVRFSPDGQRLAAGLSGSGAVKIWDASQKHEATVLKGHTGTVTTVSFSPDGSRMYSESEKQKLVWDVPTGKQLPDAKWQPPAAPIRTSPDKRWFVTAEMNNVVLVDLEYKDTPSE
ncbi:protein kinase [bacterium]|nr:protein kinase [bacterium]